jgi:hypothetical protein
MLIRTFSPRLVPLCAAAFGHDVLGTDVAALALCVTRAINNRSVVFVASALARCSSRRARALRLEPGGAR